MQVEQTLVPGRGVAPPTVSAGETRIHYSVKRPMMVLAFKDNHDAAVSIPAGEVFDVIGSAEDDRFTIVEVRGDQFLAFDSDLKDGRLFQVWTESNAA